MDIINEIPANQKRALPEIKLNTHGNRSRTERFWLALKYVCWNYVENTQVHGFFYLRAIESRGCKRFFWIFVIIVAFLIGAFILAELIGQFLRVPITVTVGKSEQLMKIPFPSISICHPQTVINYKAKQFVNKIKIPDGYDKDDVMEMLPTALGIFTENHWAPPDINYLAAMNEILELNGLSVLDVVEELGINCPDFILRCSFNKSRFPCFQDDEHFTFRETMSHIGICCSFNYNPSNISYEPLKVNSYGVRGGLSFIGTSIPYTSDGRSGIIFSNGYILLLHSPTDYPTSESDMTLLEIGKITSIGVYPTISTVSADVEALALKNRRCLTGRDADSNYYSRSACISRCLTQFIYDKCGCHPHFLPTDSVGIEMRSCTVTDGECFHTIYFERKKLRCSFCLPSCDDISYKMSTATISYNFANTSINPMYEQTNVTVAEFTAHIYFAGSTVPVKKTIISQSFIQLLSNFGGVFNLVLGISVFSILELFYYFAIKIPQYMKMNKKIRPVITTINPASKQ